MAMEIGGSRAPIPYVEGVDIVPYPVVDLILIRKVAEKSGTRSEGPCVDVDASTP